MDLENFNLILMIILGIFAIISTLWAFFKFAIPEMKSRNKNWKTKKNLKNNIGNLSNEERIYLKENFLDKTAHIFTNSEVSKDYHRMSDNEKEIVSILLQKGIIKEESWDATENYFPVDYSLTEKAQYFLNKNKFLKSIK